MKLYKKGDDSSYTLGVFPTIELLEHKPDIVKKSGCTLFNRRKQRIS